MQIYSLQNHSGGYTYSEIQTLPRGAAMVLGFFDGVHLGHASLISEATEYAKTAAVPVCVWTFSSLPKAERVITTTGEKLAALSSLGADCAVIEDFDEVRSLSPSEFYDDYLIKHFSPCALFCGFNFRYGKGAEGTTDTLKASANAHGTRLFVLPPYEADGMILSSSMIRRLISDGKINDANRYLVSPFSITSCVLHGNSLGQSFGYPTLNQHLPDEKLVPKCAVYVSRVEIDGKTYGGVSDIGRRPTVNDTDNTVLETHVFGYSGDAYGKEVTVTLLSMIREERKFPSVDALIEQIRTDADYAEKYLRGSLEP